MISRNFLSKTVIQKFRKLHNVVCGKTINSLHAGFFPSNQFIVKFFYKTLIWRNFCEKFRNFHSVVWKNKKFMYYHWKIFSQINSLVNLLISRNSYQKWWESTVCTLWKLRKNTLTLPFFRETIFWIFSYSLLWKLFLLGF